MGLASGRQCVNAWIIGVYDYCVREGIQLIYARCFMNANPFLIKFFKGIRKAGIHAVTEIYRLLRSSS